MAKFEGLGRSSPDREAQGPADTRKDVAAIPTLDLTEIQSWLRNTAGHLNGRIGLDEVGAENRQATINGEAPQHTERRDPKLTVFVEYGSPKSAVKIEVATLVVFERTGILPTERSGHWRWEIEMAGRELYPGGAFNEKIAKAVLEGAGTAVKVRDSLKANSPIQPIIENSRAPLIKPKAPAILHLQDYMIERSDAVHSMWSAPGGPRYRAQFLDDEVRFIYDLRKSLSGLLSSNRPTVTLALKQSADDQLSVSIVAPGLDTRPQSLRMPVNDAAYYAKAFLMAFSHYSKQLGFPYPAN